MNNTYTVHNAFCYMVCELNIVVVHTQCWVCWDILAECVCVCVCVCVCDVMCLPLVCNCVVSVLYSIVYI